MELNYFQRNNAGGEGNARLEQFKEWENRHEFRQVRKFGCKKRKMGSGWSGTVEMKEGVLKSGSKLSIF